MFDWQKKCSKPWLKYIAISLHALCSPLPGIIYLRIFLEKIPKIWVRKGWIILERPSRIMILLLSWMAIVLLKWETCHPWYRRWHRNVGRRELDPAKQIWLFLWIYFILKLHVKFISLASISKAALNKITTFKKIFPLLFGRAFEGWYFFSVSEVKKKWKIALCVSWHTHTTHEHWGSGEIMF